MKKIYLRLASLPMLNKENERLKGKHEEMLPAGHIDNYVDIYNAMVGNPYYADDIDNIKREISLLKNKIRIRNSESIVGEVVDGSVDNIPTLRDDENLQQEALNLLTELFPDAEVTHENPHAGQFSVSDMDGKYAFCGFTNGDLECDLYDSEASMAEGEPLSSKTIAYVRS